MGERDERIHANIVHFLLARGWNKTDALNEADRRVYGAKEDRGMPLPAPPAAAAKE